MSASWKRWGGWWAVGVLAAVLVLALPIVTYPLGRDQGEFAVIGRGLLQGWMPYIDLWNPKPPAIFLTYAWTMSIFGQSAVGLRVLDLLAMTPVLVSLMWIASRLGGRDVGLWSALLFGVFYFSETFWTLTQNDGIAVLPMVLAVVCVLKAADGTERRAVWAFAAGLLFGIVLMFKYPFALFGLVLAAAYLLFRPGERSIKRHDVAAALSFGAGTVLIAAAVVVWLAQGGALEAWLESVRVTLGYTALGLDSAEFSELMTTAVAFRWSHWGLLFLLALAGLFAGIGRRTLILFVLWLACAGAIMLSQLRGYDYHWLPMLPPLALLGAYGLTAVSRLAGGRLSSGARAVNGLIALVLLTVLALNTYGRSLPYLLGQEDPLTYADRFVAGEFVAGESQRTVDFLRARVAPGDSLYVWGFRPELYFLAGLNPPTRFIFQFPLVGDWYPATWREENAEVLWAALPPYTVVAQVDYLPFVTGREEDSNTLLQEYTELNNWLMFNYELETQIGNLFIWKRKPAPM